MRVLIKLQKKKKKERKEQHKIQEISTPPKNRKANESGGKRGNRNKVSRLFSSPPPKNRRNSPLLAFTQGRKNDGRADSFSNLSIKRIEPCSTRRMGRGAINRARNKQCQHRSPLLHLADKIATPRKAKDEEEEEGGGEACRIYLQPRRRDILTANFGQPLSTLSRWGAKSTRD